MNARLRLPMPAIFALALALPLGACRADLDATPAASPASSEATTAPAPLGEASTLATIAARRPGASRVFQRHGLDFCCGGGRTLAAACAEQGLEPATLLAEIEAASSGEAAENPLDPHTLPLPDLVDHIATTWHAAHRRDLPSLIARAEKVERVHAGREAAPEGLARHLRAFADDLERHMVREERELFPAVRGDVPVDEATVVAALEDEHQEAAAALKRTRALTRDFALPPEACPTWRGLYADLEAFERAVMEHAGLENNVLFPRLLGAVR